MTTLDVAVLAASFVLIVGIDLFVHTSVALMLFAIVLWVIVG
jgi:hypothetical protein